jgi:putative transposase
MLKNHFLAKTIQDGGWNRFTNMLAYKMKILGQNWIEVNSRYTSQI